MRHRRNDEVEWKVSREKVEKVWERPAATEAEKQTSSKEEKGWSGGTSQSTGVDVASISFLVPAHRGASWTVRLEPGGVWKARRYGQQTHGREAANIGASILAGNLWFVPRELRALGLGHWNAATGALKLVNYEVDTDNAMCTSLILVDNRLFHRAQDGIVCYDLRKP